MSARRAPLRPLRRPVRARDADAGADRARGGVDRARATTRRSGPRSTRCCATTSAARRRCTWPSGSARPPATRSTSSARTSTTPARTRSTTRSARRCWPSAWASADHRRDRRRPARRRHRHRLRAARPRVHRLHGHRGHAPPDARTSSGWSCSGAVVEPVEAGARTLKEAVSAAIRDWVANVETTHYIIGSCVGPAPYPALVRDLQRVIGDEARAQMLEQAGRLPERVIACVGGGSNAIGMFTPFVDDPEVELIGVEAAGEGIETGRHGAPLTVGGPRRRAARLVLGDHAGRGRPDPRGALDLGRPRLPGHRPRARLAARQRPRHATSRSPTEQALDAFATVARLEGIIPALESSHALAWALANRRQRARPGLPLGARRQGPGRGAAQADRSSSGSSEAGRERHDQRIERIAEAFESARADGRRAALMPYLMGGYPGPRALARDRPRLRRRRRRPDRARRARSRTRSPTGR